MWALCDPVFASWHVGSSHTDSSIPSLPPVNFCICFQCSSLPTYYLSAGLLSVIGGARATQAVYWIHFLLPLLPARSLSVRLKAALPSPTTILSLFPQINLLSVFIIQRSWKPRAQVSYTTPGFLNHQHRSQKKQKQKQNTRVSFTSRDFRGA